jgi:hypothetical protein
VRSAEILHLGASFCREDPSPFGMGEITILQKAN